jgi:hypothetical protein
MTCPHCPPDRSTGKPPGSRTQGDGSSHDDEHEEGSQNHFPFTSLAFIVLVLVVVVVLALLVAKNVRIWRSAG